MVLCKSPEIRSRTRDLQTVASRACESLGDELDGVAPSDGNQWRFLLGNYEKHIETQQRMGFISMDKLDQQ